MNSVTKKRIGSFVAANTRDFRPAMTNGFLAGKRICQGFPWSLMSMNPNLRGSGLKCWFFVIHWWSNFLGKCLTLKLPRFTTNAVFCWCKKFHKKKNALLFVFCRNRYTFYDSFARNCRYCHMANCNPNKPFTNCIFSLVILIHMQITFGGSLLKFVWTL